MGFLLRSELNRVSLLNEYVVVIPDIHLKVILKIFFCFGRAPGFSDESINICSQHGVGVVDCK